MPGMDTPTKYNRAALSVMRMAARVFLITIGTSAILWTCDVLPLFWREATLENAASRVIRGDAFKAEIVRDLIPEIERPEASDYCHAKALHNAAIVRLRLLEIAIASGEREDLDRNFALLRSASLKSLACSPANAFLWNVLYWVDTSTRGFNANALGFLRMSYEVGGHEGWVALKRNRLAMAIYEQLPAETANLAAEEFANLLESGYIQETASILEGPGWANRDVLLRAIARVSSQKRQLFASAVYRDGYDLSVPGAMLPESRPWR
jgi:hypothetical protein